MRHEKIFLILLDSYFVSLCILSLPDLSVPESETGYHQEILQNQLGNTPKPMIKMIECAMKEGAQGVKIVGSGGGGCFVALTPKTNVTKLITRLEEAGVKNAFSVKITPPHHE